MRRAPADIRSRALLEAMRDGVWIVDRGGRITEVNERFCEMVGFSAAELIGSVPPRCFWPEEQYSAMEAAFAASLRGNRGHYELICKRKNGERFPVSIDASPIGEDGGFLCVVRDLSAEQRARQRLEEAHDVARLASWEWFPETDEMEISTGLAELAQIEIGEDDTPTLELMLSFVPAPHDQFARDALLALLSGEQTEAVYSIPWNVPNPEVQWIEVRARPVLDPEGRPVRIRGTTQDITARKLAELAYQRSEDRLRQAQRLADLGSFEVDYRTGEVSWSDELYRLYGVDPSRFSRVVEAARELLPPADREKVQQAADRTVRDGRPRQVQHRYMRGDEIRWAETRLERLDGHSLRGTLQDITASRLAERRLHLQAHLLHAVDAAVIAIELDGTIAYWNHGAERTYGWTAAETQGRPLSEIAEAVGHGDVVAGLVERVTAAGQWEGQFDVARKDGSRFPAYLRMARFLDPDGKPAGVVTMSVDISERVEGERQLKAARDYMKTVTDSMAEGLFTVDTEGRLIYINQAGEEMLGWSQDELIGQAMHDKTHYRHPDGSPFPARDCRLVQVRERGEIVRLDHETFFRKDGSELPVEITSAPFETEDGVRGSVVVFSDITERLDAERRMRDDMETVAWVGRVRDALVEDRFVLYAQPIVDIQTGRVAQHELLLRMVDTDGSIMRPAAFLPAAEEYGLIVEVDRWVARQAIGFAAQGHAVALNLSARSISAPDLLEDFQRELERTGADPSLIVVELTETALLEDEHAAARLFERIGALGCQLALDDFGTGYGGFRYLKRLPVDLLKIDMDFVRDLRTNEASQHVVKAVVNLAHDFGQRTVAEGVEDEGTLQLLRELGVDYAQGYVFARPAPACEVLGAVASDTARLS